MRQRWKRLAEDTRRLAQAEHDLEQVKRRWPDVRAASKKMDDWRARNHLQEIIAASFRGER